MRRDDPDGLGRIKVKIPGLVEPESVNWAYPLGAVGGGNAQRGNFEPPANRSNVGVLFLLGDVDRPFYLTGPWGQPGGQSDVPTGGVVEGDNRQNAVHEDEEWLIERDSRAASKIYRVKHKSSGAEIVISGDGKVYLGSEGATEALVLGSQYRSAEQSFLNSFHTAVSVFATAAKVSTDPTLAAAASTLETSLAAISGSDIIGDATAYISDKVFTE